MRRSLTKTNIIRKKEEIDRIFKDGDKFSSQKMRLIALNNGLNYDRFIVIPVKHYGNSVERNKIRRQTKEIFRKWEGRLIESSDNLGVDIVLVVYPGKVSSFSLLEANMKSLLVRIKRK